MYSFVLSSYVITSVEICISGSCSSVPALILVPLMLFTDEAGFTRYGIMNFHNQPLWKYVSLRGIIPSHHR